MLNISDEEDKSSSQDVELGFDLQTLAVLQSVLILLHLLLYLETKVGFVEDESENGQWRKVGHFT
jgi:hypothetical protein